VGRYRIECENSFKAYPYLPAERKYDKIYKAYLYPYPINRNRKNTKILFARLSNPFYLLQQ